MDKYTFYQEVKIEDGKLQMVVSNEQIISQTIAIDQYDFYSRIKLDENGKIIIKIKE